MDAKQEFSITMYQIFRSAGVTLSTDQTERLRETSDKLFKAIEDASRARAVELIRKMQEAVGEGFKSIGKDIDGFEARIRALEINEAKDDGAGNVMPKVPYKPATPYVETEEQMQRRDEAEWQR